MNNRDQARDLIKDLNKNKEALELQKVENASKILDSLQNLTSKLDEMGKRLDNLEQHLSSQSEPIESKEAKKAK